MNLKATLASKTVAELRELAAQFRITGRSTMKKADLVNVLSDDEHASLVEMRIGIDEITPEQSARYAEQYNAAKTQREAVAEQAAPAVHDHAAAVAQLRANIDAEEEQKAAARRARNRSNYAPAPATEPAVNQVAILRDAPGTAIVTASFDGRTVGGSIVRRGSRLVLMSGSGTIVGTSFEKVARRFAARLGFHADVIDVAKSF